MRVSTDEISAKRIADLFVETFEPETVAASAFESDTCWSVEVHFVDEPDRATIKELLCTVSGDMAGHALFETVAPKDWVATSLEGLTPVCVGPFVVYGAHDRPKIMPNRIGIEIEAALAFGTGHHGTTQGCLAAIERSGRSRRPKHALDLGTGTGVLAIALARRIRRKVIAGDIDSVSVKTARANVQANRAGKFVQITRAVGVNAPLIRAGSPYDFVLANILLPTLKQLARPVRLLLAPCATVILSGVLQSQANAALAIWHAKGLTLLHRETIEGWTTLTLVRRKT
jgi:ribosomal protein L11 methyltransferase